MKTAIEKLEDVTAIATSPGNANANPYMLGMANGLILARAIMKDEEVEYLKAPETWLSDLPTPTEPTVANVL
jgi:hypothetical protein